MTVIKCGCTNRETGTLVSLLKGFGRHAINGATAAPLELGLHPVTAFSFMVCTCGCVDAKKCVSKLAILLVYVHYLPH